MVWSGDSKRIILWGWPYCKTLLMGSQKESNLTKIYVMVFKSKVQLNYETEIYIARTSNNMKFLREKWAIIFNRCNNLVI